MAHPGLLEQVYVLGRRAFFRVLRQPGQLIFPFVFPIILFAVNAAGLNPATKLPGFPTSDYKDFALAVPFMQGALFVAINAGTDLASDIENGFLNRLSLTPMLAPALLAGQLGGVLLVSIVQAIVYVCVGLIVGVGFASGPAGVLVLLVLATLIGFAFAGIGALLALRFGSGEAVQGFFPLLFVLVFLSSSSLPRNLISTDWFRTVATYNPVSYLIEGIRSLIITGWDGQALAMAFGIALAITVGSLGLSSVALRGRLGR
ncbi:MAG: type transport system permease protein [Thermoleophilaceae bacterium]|nr:type transport system permease protein [Thermoleophilaceae bacterium]